MKQIPVRLILALVGLMLLGVLANAFLSQYLLRVLIVTGISVIFVASLAISNGFTGVFSLGHPAFIAIGAYTSGILTLEIAKKGLYLPDLPVPICPLSGVSSACLMWALTALLTQELVARGLQPSVYESVNLPGGMQRYTQLRDDYSRNGL